MPQAMTIDIVKELIKSYSAGHRRFLSGSPRRQNGIMRIRMIFFLV